MNIIFIDYSKKKWDLLLDNIDNNLLKIKNVVHRIISCIDILNLKKIA
jgi:hypothetical protein